MTSDSRPLSMDVPDEVLAGRVAQGDVNAFTVLYDRYARTVYALAAHMLGGAEAEDLAQDIFVRLWRRAGQFDPGRGSFSGWFIAVARHRILDEINSRSAEQRHVAAVEIEAILAMAPDGSPGVEQQVWERERARSLLEALAELPPEQRRVVVLAYFGGLTHRSIAEVLDWPLGTVKKRIRLGLQKLRRSLRHEEAVSEKFEWK